MSRRRRDGWTSGGEPIVRLLKGACGVYVFADGRQRVDGELEPALAPRDVE